MPYAVREKSFEIKVTVTAECTDNTGFESQQEWEEQDLETLKTYINKVIVNEVSTRDMYAARVTNVVINS